MAQTLEIRFDQKLVGEIRFDEPPQYLQAQRTAGGFRLLLPIEVALRYVRRGEAVPMFGNLRGELSILEAAGGATELGVVSTDETYASSATDDGRGERKLRTYL